MQVRDNLHHKAGNKTERDARKGFVDKSRTDITADRNRGVSVEQAAGRERTVYHAGNDARTICSRSQSHDEQRPDPCQGK